MSSRIALRVYYNLLKIDIFLLEAKSKYFKNMITANKLSIPIKKFAADTKNTVSKYAMATVEVFFPDLSLLVSSLPLSISANFLATRKEILWKTQRPHSSISSRPPLWPRFIEANSRKIIF